MQTQYGIDPNGNPAVGGDDNSGGNGSQNQCGQGYRWDTMQQSCVPTNNQATTTTNPPTSTTGGNPASPQTNTPPPGTTTPPGSTTTPPVQYASYVNPNDPTQLAVWNAFAAKGIQPGGPSGGQGDFQYWVDWVNKNGGPTSPYTLSRMGQANGGVGDYGTGGGGGGSMDAFLGGANPTLAPTTPPPGFTPWKPTTLHQPTSDLIAQLLGSTSLSPAVVAQMKESQKTTELSMADQIKQSIAASAANRGVSGGSAPTSDFARVDMNAAGNISRDYSGIDIAKATQDRTDQQNAVSLSDAFEGNAFNRDQTSQMNALQSWLSSQGITLNWAQLQEAMRQYNMGNQLDVAKFLGGA